MNSPDPTRKLSQAYLTSIPPVSAALGFAVGHISYKIYLPVWIVAAFFMATAVWILGNKKNLAVNGAFLILPWLFISIFFGMGPPPGTAARWVQQATEQQARYTILTCSGIFMTIGFAILNQQLRKAGEHFYSLLGNTAIMIAIPLFIINMCYWGFFLTASFRFFTEEGSVQRPDWYRVSGDFFYVISIVEISLIYVGTAAFAVSLKKAGLFKPTASRVYIIFCFIGLLLDILPPRWPEPFATLSYLPSIPAVPMIMPYLIGIQLLRKQVNAFIGSP
jgi:hypothetical protein